jgi:signal transduction histidine kinase
MLARDNDAIVLEIQDNGAGIPEKQLSSSDSLGILGMKERALIFGGTVEVHGGPDMGTTVRARISLR